MFQRLHSPFIAPIATLAITVSVILMASEVEAQSEPVEVRPSTAEGKIDEAGFKPLFDGKSLYGWEGEAKWFRIEQGAVVAGTLAQKIPNNFFLCTTDQYKDFELRLQVKVVGQGANAGVQFRTQRIPNNHEVSGYQADVGVVGDNRSVWGALYDESRRNRMLTEPPVSPDFIKLDDWNDYTIRCQGSHIELFVNGVKTADYNETDDKISQSGVIALQIHGGAPSEAWYRNIRLKPL